MAEPGRQFNAASGRGYRFGFNGKEQDNDIDGTGVGYEYGARIYDARVGRFFSVDPLQKTYPDLTPYQFASNTPVVAIDLDGLEAVVTTTKPAPPPVPVAKIISAGADGTLDAVINAEGMGIPDYLGLTNNLSHYKTPEEQAAYLRGRIIGDDGVLAASAYEAALGINTTRSGLAGALATSETGVGAGGGLVVAGAGVLISGHAAASTSAATFDMTAAREALLEITKVQMAAVKDATSSTTTPTNKAADGASGTPQGSTSNTANSPTTNQSNPFLKKSKQELLNDKETFENMIKEHQKKLEDFKKDPIANSDPEWLKVATKDNPTKEELLKRAQGRIPALEKQIKKQEGELQKINDALKTKK